MSTTDIASWQSFFGIVAQVGATLAGLLFVGLTINLQHVLAARGYLSRAFCALFLQFEILVIGIFGLTPNQPPWTLGAEFIVTGLALFAGISVFCPEFSGRRKLGGAWIAWFANYTLASHRYGDIVSGC
jgi:hypothetical protein